MSTAIRQARASDFPVVRGLLAAADLPVDDFAPEHLVFVGEAGGTPVGGIGLEALGDIGLLRSLVVARQARSSGLGGRLVAALEDEARSRGIRELWLLTIDADAYFRGLGYEVRHRDDAPAGIRGTAEFSGLCPGTAVLMSKGLAGQVTVT